VQHSSLIQPSSPAPARHAHAWLVAGGLAIVSALAAQPAPNTSQLPPPTAQSVDFDRDIRPIFQARCLECHGPTKQKGGFRLDDRDAALKGGENHSPAIHPGKSAESPLIKFVAGLAPDTRMPPKGEALSSEQISLLRAWIDQGATWPQSSSKTKRSHWSFQPVTRPALPSLAGNPLPNLTPIDAFLASKLTEHKLSFSPPADRTTLIRRLYLVMHGLPPEPAEVERFVHDPHPEAYAHLVERVLASPHTGERWARHWLDVARYADSNGFETNRERKNAYPYRDYVIHALNTDKPYDQFVREQIAGDALGSDLATGFLVAGAYDIVKSPDINLTLMQRQDELADIINTTGTAFLGLTLGCARCHDHKFDPISQKDYYALQAVFAGVQFAERPLKKTLRLEEQRELDSLQTQKTQAEIRLNTLKHKAASGNSTPSSSPLKPALNAALNVEEFSPLITRSVRFTILDSGGAEPCLDELEVYDPKGTNVAAAALGSKASTSGTLPGHAIHKLEHIHDGLVGNSKSWISNTRDGGWVQIDFPEPKTIQRIVWSRDREERFRDRLPVRYRIEALSPSNAWKQIACSEDHAPHKPGQNDALAFLAALPETEAQEARELVQSLKSLSTRINQIAHGNSAWLGSFSQPQPTKRLYRGDPSQEREVVPPGAPAALGSLGLDSNTPEQKRRVDFAQWLANRDNPLTARVMVNRIWQHIFGIGIVDTPSDFGANGTTPVHPALLDWLSSEFIQSGWSVKHVQRLLLLSHAFRQSSAPRTDHLAADADARWLWRFPPRRLEAESIRDGMLATSGALDKRMGGPGFHLQKVEQDNVYRYFPKEAFGPPEFRRMIYLARIRQEQDSVFGSFDCPSGNQVMPRRPRSNTPLQALNLFNSTFVLQQASLLSHRLQREVGSAVDQQVRRAFQLTHGRTPDGFELNQSIDFIQHEGLEAFCRALYNTSEFLFVF